MTPPKPPKPTKRDKLAADIAIYLRGVGRKAQKGKEPNDRSYDRQLERRFKQLSPLEIDTLTRAHNEDE